MSAYGFRKIRDSILDRIAAGDWPPGTFIPSEIELAKEYGCARTTINRALQKLAQEGVVERKRRAGTRVKEVRSRVASIEIPIIRTQVEEAGGTYDHHVLLSEVGPAPSHIAASLRLQEENELLHLKTMHLMNDQPYAFEDRWVNVDAVPSILQAPLDSISANEWLVREAPYSDGTMSFTAVAAEREVAKAFNTNVNEPLFAVERITWNNDKYITNVRIFYKPGYRLLTYV